MPQSDAIVIGAGAIGASVAYQLAMRGLRVRVLEATGVASGATGASEGLVGSVTKRKSGPVTDIVVNSFGMFPSLVEDLGDEIEFCRKPGLMVVEDEAHVDLLMRFAAKRRSEGLEIEWLDRASVHEAEPLLADHIVGGLLTPDQGAVNPIHLAHGYIRSSLRRGAAITRAARVQAFELRGGRIERIRTSAGDFSAGIVINAAGQEASGIAGLAGAKLHITPKRAQMIVSERLPAGTLRNTIYAGANVVAGLDPDTLEFEDMPADPSRRQAELDNPWQLSSFTQTRTGNVLFCGGFGFVGATASVDPRTVATMMRNILRIIPAFASTRILRGWAGLEPCTPDNLPVMGFADEVTNLVHAAGHGNAGVMMSPCTGVLVSNAIASSIPARGSAVVAKHH